MNFFQKSVILDLIYNGWLELSYAVKCDEQNCSPGRKTLDSAKKFALKQTEKKLFSVNHYKSISLNDNYMTETCVFFLKRFSMTGVIREFDAVGPQRAKMQRNAI